MFRQKTEIRMYASHLVQRDACRARAAHSARAVYRGDVKDG